MTPIGGGSEALLNIHWVHPTPSHQLDEPNHIFCSELLLLESEGEVLIVRAFLEDMHLCLVLDGHVVGANTMTTKDSTFGMVLRRFVLFTVPTFFKEWRKWTSVSSWLNFMFKISAWIN